MPDYTEEAERLKAADIKYSKWQLLGPVNPRKQCSYPFGITVQVYNTLSAMSNQKTNF